MPTMTDCRACIFKLTTSKDIKRKAVKGIELFCKTVMLTPGAVPVSAEYLFAVYKAFLSKNFISYYKKIRAFNQELEDLGFGYKIDSRLRKKVFFLNIKPTIQKEGEAIISLADISLCHSWEGKAQTVGYRFDKKRWRATYGL